MKTVTKQYEVYKFNELSEEGRENALNKLADINVDYDDWYDDDIYNEFAGDIGLHVNIKDACFDLDRGNYLYFETYNHNSKKDYIPGIYVDDSKKFCISAGLNWKSYIVRNNAECISIGHLHYGGGSGRNIIGESFNCELSRDDFDKLEILLESFIEKCFLQLKDSYEYSTSRESIIDTIEANDYDFTEDGNIF